MLKKRIIPVQLLVDQRLVKTVRFGAMRDVGDPVASSRVYSAQSADELCFLNIARDARSIAPLIAVLERVSAVCFMPLSLGGGIVCDEDAANLIRLGADKVVINSALYRDVGIITRVGGVFGAQAVIAAIDARAEPDGGWSLWSDCGRVRQDVSLSEHVRACVAAGAGELLIQSIDRDGTMGGYDLALIQAVQTACPRPVIALGGAGTYDHLLAAFQQTGVSALAMGSLFNFGDNNPLRAKAHLSNHGLRFKVI